MTNERECKRCGASYDVRWDSCEKCGLPNPDKLMERTRAAVAYANTSNDPGTNMVAFMALFHPEVPQDQVRKMAQDARSKDR